MSGCERLGFRKAAHPCLLRVMMGAGPLPPVPRGGSQEEIPIDPCNGGQSTEEHDPFDDVH